MSTRGKEPMVETAKEANPVAEPETKSIAMEEPETSKAVAEPETKLNAAEELETKSKAAVEPETKSDAAEEQVITLCVDELDISVTEEQLKELCDQIGEVRLVSIRVDQANEEPQRYAYVIYRNPQDAAKAMGVLNFSSLNGKPIYIARAYKDKVRDSLGILFFKNFDVELDKKDLIDMFSKYGKVLSCNIEENSVGISKGYGYVQFDNEEDARNATEHLNGIELKGKKFYVDPDIKMLRFTQVFVNNISERMTDNDLKLAFEQFGPINNVTVIRGVDGNSKGFGFVTFVNWEDASMSVDILNKSIMDGRQWVVENVYSSSELEYMNLRLLIVKNIDDRLDDDAFRELFAPYGTITSCKILCDCEGNSKGTGFVVFSAITQALDAKANMNGILVLGKPLIIAIAERKENREARPQMRRVQTALTIAPPRIPMHTPGGPGLEQHPQAMIPSQHVPVMPHLFVPTVPLQQDPQPVRAVQQYPQPSRAVQQYFQPVRGMQQDPQPVRVMQQYPLPVPGMQQDPQPVRVMQQDPQPSRGVQQYPLPVPGMQQGPQPSRGVQQGLQTFPLIDRYFRVQQGPRPVRVTQQYPLPVPVTQQQQIVSDPPAHKRCKKNNEIPVLALAAALIDAFPHEKNSILGDNLYPRVEKLVYGMAGKVTGMLLELNQSEVMRLLGSDEALEARVSEAVEVLRNTPAYHVSSPSYKPTTDS